MFDSFIKRKIFKYKFNWVKLYSDVSETYGGSPKTLVMTLKELKLFNDFEIVYPSKDRLGEFFEYKPYNTVRFPKFFQKNSKFLFFGKNILVMKLEYKLNLKEKNRSDGKLLDVIFKHY